MTKPEEGMETVVAHHLAGTLLHSFLLDHLIAIKGLRLASVHSYRDAIRLLLLFFATEKHSRSPR